MGEHVPEDLAAEITAMIARVTDCAAPGLGAESRFEDIDGWSSMAALSLMVGLEQDLPVKLDLRTFMSVQTVGELTSLVAS